MIAAIGRAVTITNKNTGEIKEFDCIAACHDSYKEKVSSLGRKLVNVNQWKTTLYGEDLVFDVEKTKFLDRRGRAYWKDTYDIQKYRDGTIKDGLPIAEQLKEWHPAEEEIVQSESELKNPLSLYGVKRDSRPASSSTTNAPSESTDTSPTINKKAVDAMEAWEKEFLQQPLSSSSSTSESVVSANSFSLTPLGMLDDQHLDFQGPASLVKPATRSQTTRSKGSNGVHTSA